MNSEAIPVIEEDAEGTDSIPSLLLPLPAIDVHTTSKTFQTVSRPVLELTQLDETHFNATQKTLVILQRLDDKCAQLHEEGRYTDALECMEKGLVLRQHVFGAASEEVWTWCRTVGEMCNLLAMTYLKQENFQAVLELLRKAEILTERHPAGRAVTLNNLACYSRRQGKLHKAITYLHEALKIEARLENLPNKADTHLNMCAILSQLGKHQSALGHAQSALTLLHEELQLGRAECIGLRPPQTPRDGKVRGKMDSPIRLDRVAVLGIAYHNAGVEQEFLKCWDLSQQSYTKGKEITATYLGESHGIVTTLENSLQSAKQNMASKLRTAKTRGDGISLPSLNNKVPGIKSLVAKKSKAKMANRESLNKLPLTHGNNGSSSLRL